MSTRNATSTAVRSEIRGLASARFAPPTLKHDAPWRRVLLRYMLTRQRNGLPVVSLTEIYRRMGFRSETDAYVLRKVKRLHLVKAAQMAQALELPDREQADFLLELAREEGVPPIGEKALLRPSVPHSVRMGSSAPEPARASSSRRAIAAPVRRRSLASSMLEVRSSLRPMPRRQRPKKSE